MTKIVRNALRRLAIGNNVRVGKDFRAGLGARVNALHGLQIGSHVSLGPGSVIEVDGRIGDYVLIARGVQIVGRADHDISAIGVPIVNGLWVGERPQILEDEVTIERDVWIGANVVVLGGVTIGEGSVIGAGSVVSRDIPPFSIAAGIPAKPIARRFKTDDERRAHTLALDLLSSETNSR